jgi:hypothetical protein
MRKTINYIRNLTLGKTRESSKRFLALYVGVILVGYIVFRFTNLDNVEIILGELFIFVLTLLGIATYENVKHNNKIENNDNKEKDKE